MPNLPRKAIVFLAYVKLLFRPGWIMPKPIYTASGLLLVAIGLLFSVFYSLKDAAGVPPGTNNYALIGSHAVEQPNPPVVIIQPQQLTKQSAVTSSAAPQYETAKAEEYGKEKPRWPVRGEIVREFGWQEHQVFKDWRYHNGIDISAPEGQPVQAVLGGEVQEICNDKNYGQTVIVKSGRYTVMYGSLSAIAVNRQDIIQNGAKIGTAGSFTAEPGIHVHLAIKDGDKFIDPRSLLK